MNIKHVNLSEEILYITVIENNARNPDVIEKSIAFGRSEKNELV